MSLSDAERDALEQLQEAIESGDLSLLRKLLNQTDLTNYPFAGTEDRTLLHLACIFGERECVVELLRAGADPNAVDDNGSTPLHLTINEPHVYKTNETDDRVRILETLLQAGAKVNITDIWGETPLHDAATCRYSKCMLLLLKAGANVNEVNKMGWRPLDKAFASYNDSDTSKRRRMWPLLLRAGGVSHKHPLDKVKDEPGHDYILKVVNAGGFEKHAKAHRARSPRRSSRSSASPPMWCPSSSTSGPMSVFTK